MGRARSQGALEGCRRALRHTGVDELGSRWARRGCLPSQGSGLYTPGGKGVGERQARLGRCRRRLQAPKGAHVLPAHGYEIKKGVRVQRRERHAGGGVRAQASCRGNTVGGGRQCGLRGQERRRAAGGGAQEQSALGGAASRSVPLALPPAHVATLPPIVLHRHDAWVLAAGASSSRVSLSPLTHRTPIFFPYFGAGVTCAPLAHGSASCTAPEQAGTHRSETDLIPCAAGMRGCEAGQPSRACPGAHQ